MEKYVLTDTDTRHWVQMRPSRQCCSLSLTHSYASSWPIAGFALLVFRRNTLYTLETNRELVPKSRRPAIVSGIVTGDASVIYWPIFPLSLITVPEVFATDNSSLSLLLSFVANWTCDRILVYCCECVEFLY